MWYLCILNNNGEYVLYRWRMWRTTVLLYASYYMSLHIFFWIFPLNKYLNLSKSESVRFGLNEYWYLVTFFTDYALFSNHILCWPVFSISLWGNCVEFTIYEEIQCIWVNNFSAIIYEISLGFVYCTSRSLTAKTYPRTHENPSTLSHFWFVSFYSWPTVFQISLMFFRHTKPMTTHRQTHNRSFCRLIHKSAMKHNALWVFWRNKVSELFSAIASVLCLISLSAVKMLWIWKRILCWPLIDTAKTNLVN